MIRDLSVVLARLSGRTFWEFLFLRFLPDDEPIDLLLSGGKISPSSTSSAAGGLFPLPPGLSGVLSLLGVRFLLAA